MAKVRYTEEDMADHEGIASVIKNRKGQILMQEHAKYGFWTLPVGKIKAGQTAAEGLKEELFEECGIIVEGFRETASKKYSYTRKKREVSVFIHLFEITGYSGDIKNREPHKHLKQEFISLEEIKKMPYLSDVTLLYLETLGFERKANIGFVQ